MINRSVLRLMMGRLTYKEERNVESDLLSIFAKDANDGIQYNRFIQRARKDFHRSSDTANRYLKRFVARGWVQKRLQGTAFPSRVVYAITKDGGKKLDKDRFSRLLGDVTPKETIVELPSGKYGEQLSPEMQEISSSVRGVRAYFSYPVSYRVKPVLTLVLDAKNDSHEKIDAVYDRVIKIGMAEDFVRAVFQGLYRVQAGGKWPSTYREEIDAQNKALDVEAALLIQFNGRPSRLDKKEFEDTVKQHEDSMKLRDAQLEDARKQVSITELRYKLLENILARYVDDTVESIVESVIELWKDAGFTNPPTPREIRGILRGWARKGIARAETVEHISRGDHFEEAKFDADVGNLVQTILCKKDGRLAPLPGGHG